MTHLINFFHRSLEIISALRVRHIFISFGIFSTYLTTLGSSVSLSLFVEGSHKIIMLGNQFKRTIKSSVGLTIFMSLFVIIFAKPLLLIFGKDYMNYGTSALRIITFASIPAVIISSKTAVLRVKSNLSKVIKAFAIISCISLSLSLTSIGNNLNSVSLIWVLSQIAAAIYIMRVKKDPKSAKKQIIIAHPMDTNEPSQGGGIRYLTNVLKVFTNRGWPAIVLGVKNDKRKINNPKWKQIDLISIKSKIPFVRLLPYWIRYLMALYFYLPLAHLPPRATIITHRMDCMLAFVLFRKTNPKVLISASPAHYLRNQPPSFLRIIRMDL